MNKKGFTLIEILLYSTLFTSLMMGGLLAGYRLIDTADALTKNADLQSDISFILEKIEWMVRNARDITLLNQSHAEFIYDNGDIWSIFYDSGSVILQHNNERMALHREAHRATVLHFTIIPAHNLVPASLHTELTLESE